MNSEKIYDTAMIGGGLAGLCCAVLLAKKGHSIIVFEKESYPFHKVCGEYVSNESRSFLAEEIGLSLSALNISETNKVLVTAPNGNMLTADLETGGFGISRYLLDNAIKLIAEENGVTVVDHCKVDDIIFTDDHFQIKTSRGNYVSRTCCGSWGKRSNIDIKKKRGFTLKKTGPINNYVGIKYHVKGDFPADLISLHNFKDGYCGLSKIEEDRFCLCYFMKASILKDAGSVAAAEKNILSANPELKKILDAAQKINKTPFTISQVSLSKKTAVEDHILMVGDAGGMISPLCGNGMSIAMRSAKIAAGQTDLFLTQKISRPEFEKNYSAEIKKAFGNRISGGRIIQNLFGRKIITDIFVWLMNSNKFLTKKIIRLTHGNPF